MEIYDFNGKLKREYIIKNPKKTYVSQTEKDEYGNSKENKIVRPLGKFEWEIESLSHYKKKHFLLCDVQTFCEWQGKYRQTGLFIQS